MAAVRPLDAEGEDLRQGLGRVKTERKRAPLRSPRGDDEPLDVAPIFDDEPSPADLQVLRDRVSAVEASGERNAQELTSGLVEWGTETKSYVDRSLTTAADERRREAIQELARVWGRIRQIEMRLPR